MNSGRVPTVKTDMRIYRVILFIDLLPNGPRSTPAGGEVNKSAIPKGFVEIKNPVTFSIGPYARQSGRAGET